MKKKIALFISTLIMSLSMSLLSYAAQSPRWHEQNGVWYLQNEQGTGNTVNSWFQDLDNSWYLLAPGDGHMYAGLIHDTLTDRWYFCQTEHDGWYGRMAHTDGMYTVNGQQVYLTFTQEHNGYFGAITSGLESLRATGVVTQDVAGLPTESASADTSSSQQQTPPSNTSQPDEHGFVRDENGGVSSIFTDDLWKEFEEANKNLSIPSTVEYNWN